MSVMKKTIVVNLFGGPGTGKSTTASDLFQLMKKKDIDVENLYEFAKELTWAKRYEDLKIQPYVFGEQLRRFHDKLGQVDVLISDSPLLLSAIYTYDAWPRSFDRAAIDIFKKYTAEWTTYNVMLRRMKLYNPNGRNQDEEGAREIDNKIENLLDLENIYTVRTDADDKAAQRIFDSYIKPSMDVVAVDNTW